MSATVADAPLARPRAAGPRAFLVRFARQGPAGLVAGGVLLAFVLAAAAAPVISPADPEVMAPAVPLHSPNDDALFGTDFFGRDVLSRVLHGTRISLLVGGASVFASAIVGTTLGLIAGYVGRWPEYVVMRLMDVLFAFPAVLLAILVVSVFGSGFGSIVIAVATVFTPIFARVVRGSTLAVRNAEFVQAAVAAGASTGRVMVRHVLPNVAAPILVQLALGLSGAVILEAALSYLGLGAVPPTPSLGSMLSENRPNMELAPWTVLYPGLALGLLILAINIFGDAVRDLLDPRLRTDA